jgi:hypothetical protein
VTETRQSCACGPANHSIDLQTEPSLKRPNSGLGQRSESTIDGTDTVSPAVKGRLQCPHVSAEDTMPQQSGSADEWVSRTLAHIVPACGNK